MVREKPKQSWRRITKLSTNRTKQIQDKMLLVRDKKLGIKFI